jgi:hypothetical protein
LTSHDHICMYESYEHKNHSNSNLITFSEKN